MPSDAWLLRQTAERQRKFMVPEEFAHGMSVNVSIFPPMAVFFLQWHFVQISCQRSYAVTSSSIIHFHLPYKLALAEDLSLEFLIEISPEKGPQLTHSQVEFRKGIIKFF